MQPNKSSLMSSFYTSYKVLGGGVLKEYKYSGFLSYAHTDEGIAARLHKALETYPIPKTLILSGAQKLSPIFRDVTELTAHHDLPEKIRDAVNSSKFLIVLCSPAAKASHWVNEEIRLFRKLHGEASILCVLAKGSPATAFPPALTEGGREPLAASLGKSGDSFQLGVTQLAASMLGVGLDELIQRDHRRRRRRSQLLTLGALAFSGVMSVTAYTAIEARNDAEDSRNQAEGLVEYMITDLKETLEPLGQLDILDGVGDRAVEYYDSQDIETLSDDSLARQARARHVLIQVDLDGGRMDEALLEIQSIRLLTKAVLDRNPDNPDALYSHGRSEYLLGEYHFRNGDYKSAFSAILDNHKISQKLVEAEPDNPKWLKEIGVSSNSLGVLSRLLYDQDGAIEYYKQSVGYFERGLNIDPNNKALALELADVYQGLAITTLSSGSAQDAQASKQRSIDILNNLKSKFPDDKTIAYGALPAMLDLYTIFDVDLSVNDVKIKAALSDFRALVEYDPTNATWRKNYVIYLHRYLMSKQAVSSKEEQHFYDVMDGFEASDSSLDERAMNFYSQSFKAHLSQLRGDIVAQAHVDKLNEDHLTHKPRNGHEEHWDYILFRLNQRQKNTDVAKRLALKYLSHPQLISSEAFPTTMSKKAHVLASLGDCEAAHKRVGALEERGFNLPPHIRPDLCTPK